jgi:cytochrome c peroxidase
VARFRRLAAVAILLPVGVGVAADAQAPQAGAASSATSRDVELGRQLFSGAIPFAHGGPACAACHDTAALPRPGGGTMGPDLTDVVARIGSQGVQAALETLYFPTMTPLFNSHPLTAQEREALAAFLQTGNRGPSRATLGTVSLGAVAVVVWAMLLGMTAAAGRSRIRSVRADLLRRATAARKATS